MKNKITSLGIRFILPLITQSDDERGWADDKREKMGMGCMDSVIENVVNAYKQ